MLDAKLPPKTLGVRAHSFARRRTDPVAAISILYALALSGLIADSPRRHAGFIGIAFGTAIYFANFHGFTALFPWFVPLRTLDTLIVHALFGFAIAKGYWLFRRR